MSALYFILAVIVAYYVFKFSMRLLLPFAMKKLGEHLMKKAQQSQGGYTFTYTTGNPFSQQRESQYNYQNNKGDVRVDYVPPRKEKRRVAKDAGEFIDFEEVK